MTLKSRQHSEITGKEQHEKAGMTKSRKKDPKKMGNKVENKKMFLLVFVA